MLINKVINLLTKFEFEAIKTAPQFCTRFRSSRSSCNLCEENCSQDAIKTGKEVKIEYAKCNSCGQCYSSCPNGVFKANFASDNKLLAEVAKIKNKGINKLNLACDQVRLGFKERKNSLQINCLARLSEALLISILAEGFIQIKLQTASCQECQFKAGDLITKLVKNTDIITELIGINKRVFLNQKVINLTNDQQEILKIFKQLNMEQNRFKADGLKRRDLFNHLFNGVKTEFGFNKTKQEQKELSKFAQKVPVEREFLINLLDSAGQNCYNGKQESIDFTEQNIFWQIEIDDSCSFCGSCAKLCPLSALKLTNQDDKKSLELVSAFCSGCQLCVDICSKDAIKLLRPTEVEEVFPVRVKRIKSGSKKSCDYCGKETFSAKDNDIKCNGCKIQQRIREKN